MNAYSASTSTLKTLLSHPSLSKTHIESTTESLAEVLADQDEIDQAIRVGSAVAVGSAGAAMGIDEDELARELEGLVEDEKREREVERKVDEEKRRVQEEAHKSSIPGFTTPSSAVPESKSAVQSPIIAERDKVEVEKEKGMPKQDEWERQYTLAQDRKREEGIRAEAERMAKDAKRVEAE
jgi:charged multivesicular body protein 7